MRVSLVAKDGTKIVLHGMEYPLPDIVFTQNRFYTWFEYADFIGDPNGEYKEASFLKISDTIATAAAGLE